MCLIAFSYKYPKDAYLVVLANRDEFTNRPTQSADFWKEDPRVWGGVDLKSGGTWLAIREDGRFSFLTNFRNFRLSPPQNPISRGQLVKDFILSNEPPGDYLRSLEKKSDKYEGFNLVFGDNNICYYFNNIHSKSIPVDPGVYVLSNGLLNDDWYKVRYLKREFDSFLDKEDFRDEDQAISLLTHKKKASPWDLPDTGIGFWKEWALSSPFLKLPGYGTRSSTYIFVPIDKTSAPIYKEKNWDF